MKDAILQRSDVVDVEFHWQLKFWQINPLNPQETQVEFEVFLLKRNPHILFKVLDLPALLHFLSEYSLVDEVINYIAQLLV